MKVIDTMQPGENMSWCRPYVKGEYALCMNNLKAVAILIDGKTWYHYDEGFADALNRLARTVCPDYDDYKGYQDTYIASASMTETGCTECPWREECEAVQEETEDPGDEYLG